MWRGIVPGATRTASNRMSLSPSSGCAASQAPAAARDDVDLADWAFEAPGDDAIALGDEIGRGAAFRRQPGEMRRDPLRARRRFGRFGLTPARHRRLR